MLALQSQLLGARRQLSNIRRHLGLLVLNRLDYCNSLLALLRANLSQRLVG